jgi:hypothetical protein
MSITIFVILIVVAVVGIGIWLGEAWHRLPYFKDIKWPFWVLLTSGLICLTVLATYLNNSFLITNGLR